MLTGLESQKDTGKNGVIQIGKILFSLWYLVKEMHTEARVQT